MPSSVRIPKRRHIFLKALLDSPGWCFTHVQQKDNKSWWRIQQVPFHTFGSALKTTLPSTAFSSPPPPAAHPSMLADADLSPEHAPVPAPRKGFAVPAPPLRPPVPAPRQCPLVPALSEFLTMASRVPGSAMASQVPGSAMAARVPLEAPRISILDQPPAPPPPPPLRRIAASHSLSGNHGYIPPDGYFMAQDAPVGMMSTIISHDHHHQEPWLLSTATCLHSSRALYPHTPPALSLSTVCSAKQTL